MEILSEFTLVVLLFVKLTKGSPSCNWDQITRIDGNKTLCWDCPKCPHGYGLTPQCTSYVKTDVNIKCERCKNGVDYSDVNDISSCKPCSICGPNEYTIRHCNSTHNAICGKCKPRFYREITFDCWPCTKCCPDSTDDELVPGCLSQGLPAKESCRLNFKTEACAKARTTRKPTTKKQLKPTTTTTATRKSTPTTSKRFINHTIIVVQHHYQPSGSQQLWLGVGITFLVMCSVAGAMFYLCKLRKRFNYQPTSTTEDKYGLVRLGDGVNV